MSKIKSVRLPDSVIQDADDYCKVNGIGFTDLVIAGINEILHPAGAASESVVVSDPVVSAIKTAKKQPCVTIAEPAKSVFSASQEVKSGPEPKKRPVYACNFFNPQPKAIKDKPARKVPAATRPPSKPVNMDVVPGLMNAIIKKAKKSIMI